MTELSQLIAQRSNPRRRVLVWLLILAAICALAAYGLHTLRSDHAQIATLTHDLNQLEVENNRLQNRIADLSEATRKNIGDVSALDTRYTEQEKIVARLSEQYQGGRVRMQMTVVEHLLMAANERALIERDADGAAAALQLADQRLAILAEPRLYGVRRVIAENLAALREVPRADATGTALSLSSLMHRVPSLPLRSRVPQHFEVRAEPVPVATDASGTERLWASIKEALSSVFSVHRVTGAPPRLLPPDAEALVYQTLSLKLEGARLAMLRNDAISFRDLCDGALTWLRDYFRPDDAGVQATKIELERLRALKIAPPLPDLTRSLTLLRAQMDGPAR